jgi:ABC-type antimicrobial peptide transport system permease subunit
VVIGTLVLVVTLMMSMLINIYQGQRLVEFGLLQAIGYTKKQILTRVLTETVLVVILGWVLGLFAAFGLLNLAKTVMMDPKSYALDVLDPVAYAYSIPMPLAILAVAAGTVWWRFRKFDPIGVVERRIV